ncbi:RidA family protein [Actinoplanes sp. NPDC051343]|uniref:RidA family protein n=1 Tax=Actinoplanes sp. NPDC051343 TaxID=3363906 RepID=UPI0037B69FB9
MQQENRRPGPANAYEVVRAVDGDAPARKFVEAAQVAVDDAGQLVAPGDAAAQAERIFEIIRAILRPHGGTFADVMHIRTFTSDLDDLEVEVTAAVRSECQQQLAQQ